MFKTMAETIDEIANRFISADSEAPGDFTENGILHCGICGEPKRALIDWLPDRDGTPRKKLVTVMCKCKRDAYERWEQEDRKLRFDGEIRQMLGTYGISDGAEKKYLFSVDDSPDSKISRACRKYVNQWQEMRADNIGILFYGSVGTGKSFYAGCIVNALLEQMVTAAMTTLPRMLNILQGHWNRQAVVDHLQQYRFLVLDDLGAERESSFGTEQVYNIVDARYRSKLPLIVTTNLDLADMRKDPDTQRRRIYDRVVEMCPIAIKMTGASRRAGLSDMRKEKARALLGGSQ